MKRVEYVGDGEVLTAIRTLHLTHINEWKLELNRLKNDLSGSRDEHLLRAHQINRLRGKIDGSIEIIGAFELYVGKGGHIMVPGDNSSSGE